MRLPAIDPKSAGSAKPRSGRWGRGLYVTVCLVALGLAVYLTILKLTGQISDLAGCGAEGGCAEILGGRWANWLRVPITAWAIAVYTPLLLLGVAGLTTPLRRCLAFVGTGILIAAAVWFLYVQAVIEQRFCPYCCVLHGCGVIAFACVFRQVWTSDLAERATTFFLAGAVTSLTMAALIVGQLFGPQPATHELTVENDLADEASAASMPGVSDTASVPADAAASDGEAATDIGSAQPAARPGAEPPTAVSKPATADAPAAGRVVVYFDGAIRMPLAKVPLIGHPDARHVMLKYFDYTCRSCRSMHDDLESAISAYPHDLAVIVIPCPLNHECNPYAEPPRTTGSAADAHQYACEFARLGLAVWRADPTKFKAFHDQMFAQQGRMTPRAASLVAESLVDPDRLGAATSDPWIDSVLKHSVGMYGRMKQRSPRMPKLLLGGRKVLHGVTVDSAAFMNLLRQQYQLDRVSATE